MTFTQQATADTLENRIRAHRPLPLTPDWATDLVFPHYDGLSIYNIPHTIAALFGVRLAGGPPLGDMLWDDAFVTERAPIDRVVLIVSDGLGYLRLRQFMQKSAEIMEAVAALTDGRGPLPITSVTPSTTSTALPTLWTGASPAAHGMLGFRVFLRELGMLSVPLFFRPAAGGQPTGSLEAMGLDPETFVPRPGLAQALAEAAAPTYVYLHHKLFGSGLSRILHRGVEREHFRPHTGHSDVWLGLRDLLRETAGQRCYVNVYWDGVDTLSHVHGAESPYVQEEVRTQLSQLQAILRDPATHDGRTLILFTADHGHADALNLIDLDNGEDTAFIRDGLHGLFSGEPRLPYLALRAGRKPTLTDLLRTDFADRLTFVNATDALAAGLFGPEMPYAETEYRLGDLVLIPRRGWKLADGLKPSFPLVSVHGGLDEWEMLVPLLWRVV